MRKYLLIMTSIITLILTACGSGTSNTTNNKINQPGNLVIDTNSIYLPAPTMVSIKNNGDTTLTINNINVLNDKTTNTIDSSKSDCINKTLEPNNSCNITLNIGMKQQGITSVQLHTNVGEYTFPIHIDTLSNIVSIKYEQTGTPYYEYVMNFVCSRF